MNEVTLGGCYHSGMTYALGYDVNGKVELYSKLFTNFNTGINGGAVAALTEHRKQFDPDGDIELFIVALKPVEILTGLSDGDNYKLEDNSEYNKDYDDNDYDDDCDDDDDYCINCGLDPETCGCWDEDNSNELDKENITDTFRPMNAFARTRLLKIQGKL